VLLVKTMKARTALQERTADLSAQERHALILCDGHRSIDDLAGLLGQNVHTCIERLLHEGYLAGNDGAAPEPRHAMIGNLRPRQTSASNAPAGSSPAKAVRRSLVATKMYVIDMLQLQPSADSASLTLSIQASRDPQEAMVRLLDALRHIQRSSGASFARRVIGRVAEIIPEEFVSALQATQVE